MTHWSINSVQMHAGYETAISKRKTVTMDITRPWVGEASGSS